MDAETTARALGLAGSMASGIFEYLADGSPTKPFHAGWAAQAGVQAAALAAAGARGPVDRPGGPLRPPATHVDVAHDMGAQIADLGERWESPLVAIKPYPACHWIHAAVDAAVEATGDLAPDAIDRIVVRIPEVGESRSCSSRSPRSARRSPSTTRSSASRGASLRASCTGAWTSAASSATSPTPAVLALAARVEYEPWQGDFASVFAGGARVDARGTSRAVVNDAPRGAPGNPMTHDDVVGEVHRQRRR